MLALLLPVAVLAEGAGPCRQALVLGLDVSGSVDGAEYRLQRDGVAAALTAPEVAEALFAGPGHVRLAVFEWSGPAAQRVLLPWTEIGDAEALAGAVAVLHGGVRQQSEPTTALGAAILTGARMLREQNGVCWQLTLDLSGDGKSNTGPRPGEIDPGALPGRMVVNGLVIGAEADVAGPRRLVEIGELVAYFRAEVLRGPGAFVEVALGFEEFEAAMRRKLVRELRPVAVGRAE
ncbi:DUF1194 domain-containing protein [Histidinibacterium lentulum]|uniref:DUF1194 domain-containing protein n=1 Tax=Histidinibacterium lentulum TaxID=2480588 RepID=A0A3N2QYQ8_9RHOB|nr:DUF1194 domain-containing protein [Histidinibacterium lentulum]